MKFNLFSFLILLLLCVIKTSSDEETQTVCNLPIMRSGVYENRYSTTRKFYIGVFTELGFKTNYQAQTSQFGQIQSLYFYIFKFPEFDSILPKASENWKANLTQAEKENLMEKIIENDFKIPYFYLKTSTLQNTNECDKSVFLISLDKNSPKNASVTTPLIFDQSIEAKIKSSIKNTKEFEFIIFANNFQSFQLGNPPTYFLHLMNYVYIEYIYHLSNSLEYTLKYSNNLSPLSLILNSNNKNLVAQFSFNEENEKNFLKKFSTLIKERAKNSLDYFYLPTRKSKWEYNSKNIILQSKIGWEAVNESIIKNLNLKRQIEKTANELTNKSVYEKVKDEILIKAENEYKLKFLREIERVFDTDKTIINKDRTNEETRSIQNSNDEKNTEETEVSTEGSNNNGNDKIKKTKLWWVFVIVGIFILGGFGVGWFIYRKREESEKPDGKDFMDVVKKDKKGEDSIF